MTQFYEYVKMAFSNIMHNKVRSFLTMLGIIIGISSVILVMGIGNGAKNIIIDEMSGIGEGQIAMYTTDSTDTYYITNDDLDDIRNEVDGVRGITTQDYVNGSTSTVKGNFNINIACVMPEYKYFITQPIVDGRFFNESEYKSGSQCCIISEDDARSAFGSTDVVGMDIDVSTSRNNIKLKIIGVLSSDNSSLISFDFGEKTLSLYAPGTILTQIYGIEPDNFYNVAFLAEKEADTYSVATEIRDIVYRNHNLDTEDPEDATMYQIENFSDYMSIVNTVINVITVVISMIASISLMVGGIGVMNIMLVSVTERTREIGIRKALGAKTRSIMAQFLAESVIITLIGGLLGVLFGYLGAFGISRIVALIKPDLAFTPSITIFSVILATLFSSIVGIFFGIYPAKKAAKMSPIDALRR